MASHAFFAEASVENGPPYDVDTMQPGSGVLHRQIVPSVVGAPVGDSDAVGDADAVGAVGADVGVVVVEAVGDCDGESENPVSSPTAHTMNPEYEFQLVENHVI